MQNEEKKYLLITIKYILFYITNFLNLKKISKNITLNNKKILVFSNFLLYISKYCSLHVIIRTIKNNSYLLSNDECFNTFYNLVINENFGPKIKNIIILHKFKMILFLILKMLF